MKYIKEIFKLAEKYEKLYSKAAEADHNLVFTKISYVVSEMIKNQSKQAQTLLQKAATIEAGKGVTLEGNLKIGEKFSMSAKKIGGKWKVDPKASQLLAVGTLLDNSTVNGMMSPFVRKLHADILVAVEKLLNTMQIQMDSIVPGSDTITNLEVLPTYPIEMSF